MQHSEFVVRLNRPLAERDLAALRARGFELLAKEGRNTVRIVSGRAIEPEELARFGFVESATPLDAQRKLSRALREREGRAPDPEAAEIRVLVELNPLIDEARHAELLRDCGRLEECSARRAVVSIDPSSLRRLAELPGVVAVEDRPECFVFNNVATGLSRVEPVRTDLSLDGDGEIVGVADSGLDTGVNDGALLADFAGRVVNLRATVDKSALGVADAADLNNHGTHVSGSILGDGANSNGNLRGMAPAARLTLLAMGPDNGPGLAVPADLKSGIFQDAYDDGARLHNNSWGSNTLGNYSFYSRDVDEFMRDNPDLLILFAAGNSGVDASGNPGTPGTVNPPGTAKNCLTVGSSESVRPLPTTITRLTNPQDTDFDPATPDENFPLQSAPGFDQQADDSADLAGTSSRGPCDDGRIKPDLVAPGTWILSCRSSVSTADVGPDGLPHAALGDPGPYADDADGVATHAEAVGLGLPGAPIFGAFDQNTPDAPPGSGPNYQQNYFYESGTSMATPITTGATALLRQYLRQQRGVPNPSGALLKAMLVNGATVPAGQSAAPDNDRGFGWLNLENTIAPAPTGRQAISDDVDLAVATGDVRSFSVQLADPSEPFAVTLTWTDAPGSGLQNELYLRVVTPSGATIDGDVTAFPDPSNNVQRVHIAAPASGTYTIEVHGIDVTFGIDALSPEVRQDFALAVLNGVGFSPKPVDVCQVLDTSGSMGTYGYMEPAKERAKQFVDLLRVNDRAGVAGFSTTATTVHAVEPITDFGVQQAIQGNIDGMLSGGATSMGAGLERGLDLLSAGGTSTNPQAIVLLSDGHENTPPWVGGATTDSPPASYAGSNLTEILPTVPASTKVYTVSLGVQSDQLLLQEIAAATGGVFHAIHGPADLGSLHEIYLHLQALAGGEVVISSGSASVDGFGGSSTERNAAEPVAFVSGAGFRPELRPGRVDVRTFAPHGLDPDVAKKLRFVELHEIPVDETLSSVTFAVSWHDRSRPVELRLVSPSGKTYQAGDPAAVNRRGSSYQFFRVEAPEPGVWRMRVAAGATKHDRFARSEYTFAAYGDSPLRLERARDKAPWAAGEILLHPSLVGRDEYARKFALTGQFTAPAVSPKELVSKYGRELDEIRLPFLVDRKGLESELFKLPLLDRSKRSLGGASIFQEKTGQIEFSSDRVREVVPASRAGLYTLQFACDGVSAGGHAFSRRLRWNVNVD